MGEKFDIDSIKNMIDPSRDDHLSSGSFSLDDIMRDYGYGISLEKTEDVSSEAQTVVESVIEDESDSKSIATSSVSNVIDEVIEKPTGFSVTGAFEVIRSEKSTSATTEINEEEASAIIPASTDISQTHEDKEIHADIEQKRYFDTDTFNSIKDKPSANVKNSIVSFAIGNEDEVDDGEEEYYKVQEPTEEIDDFEVQEDRDDILNELKKINSSASVRTFITFILTLISGVFFAVDNSLISLPDFDISEKHNLFIILYMCVSCAATLINITSLVNGVKSIKRLRFSVETYIFFIFSFNTILNFIYLFTKNVSVIVSFDFLYMLILLFYIFSKKVIAKTLYKNFLIVSADGEKSVVNKPNNEEAVNDIMLETGCSADIVYASKSEFVSDFIAKSFRDFDSAGDILNTVIGFIVICLGVVKYFLSGSALLAFTYAAGALCGSMPILFVASFAVPLYLNSNKARKSGGVIVGAQSSEDLKDVQTLIVDDADVFNTSLNGIRLYGDSFIDDAILYLNALYSKVGGPLARLFAEMLSEDIVSLPRIDEIYYHDSMGYSGLIHSKTFVAGNKKLMDHFGVEVDDSEYEIIYQQKSKHVLFVAYDGKLMGVFLLSYNLSHGVAKAFEICEKNQIAVCIAQRDANINEKTLFEAYNPKERVLFNFISFRTARNCFEKFEVSQKTSSLLVSRTGLKGLAAALRSCKAMRFAFKTNKIISTLATLLAVPLISFLLFFSDPSMALDTQILVYQLLWSMPVLFVSFFSK